MITDRCWVCGRYVGEDGNCRWWSFHEDDLEVEAQLEQEQEALEEFEE